MWIAESTRTLCLALGLLLVRLWRARSQGYGWFRQERMGGIIASRPWALNTHWWFSLLRMQAWGIRRLRESPCKFFSSSLQDCSPGIMENTFILPSALTTTLRRRCQYFSSTEEESEALWGEGNWSSNQDYSESGLPALQMAFVSPPSPFSSLVCMALLWSHAFL